MSLFGSILEGVIDTVTTPIEVVKDVATLGGLATGEDESYTERRLKKLVEDAENTIDEL